MSATLISKPSTGPGCEVNSLGERSVRICVTALVVFFAGFRLFWGVDFTDEGYYNAVAYRFVLGDKPFVDQILVHQTAFLLFTPLVWLFHWVTGGTEGIVLFLRIMFLGFSICVTAVVYRVLRCALSRNVALLASLFCVAFSGEWVTFCYNNLGALFLLIGLMSEFRATIAETELNTAWMGLAGLANGLAVVSYPPLLLPVAFSLLVMFAYSRVARLRVIRAFAAGFFLSAVPILVVACLAGPANLVSWARASAKVSAEVGQGGGFEKVAHTLSAIWDLCFPNQAVEAATILIAGLGILFRRGHPILVILASIVFLPLIGTRFGDFGPSFIYLIRFCLWGPLLFALLPKKAVSIRRLYWYVGVPSLVAGLTTAWTSANGAMNAGVGLFPAAIVTLVMLALILEEALVPYRVLSKSFSIAVMCCFLLTISRFQLKFIYGEGPPTGLTARVDRGPYRGIATTELKAALSRALLQDLNRVDDNRRILFYDFFPAGYLFGTRRPASNITWEYPSTRSGIMAYLRDPEHRPGTVFEMKATYAHRGCVKYLDYPADDPLCAYVQAHYKLVCENPFYRIYTERESTVGWQCDACE